MLRLICIFSKCHYMQHELSDAVNANATHLGFPNPHATNSLPEASYLGAIRLAFPA